MSKFEPKFGDVYQWIAGGQKCMVISTQPMAFVEMPSDRRTKAIVKAFTSMEQKAPFTAPSWRRVR